MRYVDDALLDDPRALEDADPGGLLRAAAESGAQVRRALADAGSDALDRVVADGRPRSVLVAGNGTAAIAGDLLAAVCGPGCPVPVTVTREAMLPGSVGPLDLVVALAPDGRARATTEIAGEALRRGARVVAVAPAGSPLHELVAGSSSSAAVSLDARGLPARALLWLMTTPLLVLADALGLAAVPRAVLDRAADVLDECAVECGPAAPTAENRAKLLGASLAASLPAVWGASTLTEVAAQRMAARLAADAHLPAVHGCLPEVAHAQVAIVDGPVAAASDDDIFRDPVEDGTAPPRLRVVLLREPGESDSSARLADAVRTLAESRGVAVETVQALDGHPVVRLASLVAVLDWAAVYAAVALGVDPSTTREDAEALADLAGGGA